MKRVRFAMTTWLELGKLDEAGKLAGRCQRGMEEAEHHEMAAILKRLLAEYHFRLQERACQA